MKKMHVSNVVPSRWLKGRDVHQTRIVLLDRFNQDFRPEDVASPTRIAPGNCVWHVTTRSNCLCRKDFCHMVGNEHIYIYDNLFGLNVMGPGTRWRLDWYLPVSNFTKFGGAFILLTEVGRSSFLPCGGFKHRVFPTPTHYSDLVFWQAKWAKRIKIHFDIPSGIFSSIYTIIFSIFFGHSVWHLFYHCCWHLFSRPVRGLFFCILFSISIKVVIRAFFLASIWFFT